jgi:hypothetical protein
MLDDLIEHCSPAAHEILPTAFPIIFGGLTDAHEGVRQAASYGVGVLAQHANAQFLPKAQVTLILEGDW